VSQIATEQLGKGREDEMLSPEPELDHEVGSAERERSGRLASPHARPQLQTANTAARHARAYFGSLRVRKNGIPSAITSHGMTKPLFKA
jgi:hypothetical protein